MFRTWNPASETLWLSVKVQTSKIIESKDGDLSTALKTIGRLFMRRENGAAGLIPNGNKSPSTTSSNQKMDATDQATDDQPSHR
ncbi:hypothetical protein AVEN_52708-1 [Araneus ventricosus]|uniref:Uncharacterized protein n=1 Tax=Araneus ventricosus TaxID=182803 RepID=A0A4Y2EQM0_ARAVE|nr:hypothetical protein AVEN_52708-1 [Araneus ventricosus]